MFDQFQGCPATYLGDAVYAVHHGYAVELRVNDLHEPTHTVWLEPGMIMRLRVFDKTVRQIIDRKKSDGD